MGVPAGPKPGPRRRARPGSRPAVRSSRRAGWRTRYPSPVLHVVDLGLLADAGGRGLGRQVALGHGHHLVADHEFLDRPGAQQRRIVVDVEMPVRMAAAIGVETPRRRAFAGTLAQTLRYGENPHQQAAFYKDGSARPGVATATQHQGKEQSSGFQ